MEKEAQKIVAAAIRNIYERALEFEAELLEVNPKELLILKTVAKSGSINLKELAERTGLPLSTCGWISEKMAKNKLLQRRTADYDRRAISLSLADKGAETLKKYEAIFEKISEAALSLLSAEEGQLVAQLMEKISRSFPRL